MLTVRIRCLMLPALCGILLTAGACATQRLTPAQRGVACGLRTTDSVYLGAGPVYRPCSVSRQARRIGELPEVDFPRALEACQSVTMEFVVGTDGIPEGETARVTETNSEGYARAAVKLLPLWTYEPALLGDVPVRQIVTAQQFLQAQYPRAVARQTREAVRLPTAATRDRPVGC